MSDPNALQVLLNACAGGDHRAFERLYRLSAPRLFGLCLSMLRRRDLAEEVLQEAFVQIWRDARRFDASRSGALTWMGAIVRHRALDTLRAGHKDSAGGVALDEETRRDEGPEAVELLISRMEHGALHRCLEQLSPEQRQCIGLAFFKGLSHGELSLRLETPIGTVKSWIRRGMDALRRCLES